MAAPLAALALLVSLVAGSPAAAAGTESPAAVDLVATAAPALADAAGRPALAGVSGHAAFTAPIPSDESGCLLQPAAPATAPSLDLRRPRLDAAAVPEAPHPSLGRRRRADRGARLFDLHLVRLTKDRGS